MHMAVVVSEENVVATGVSPELEEGVMFEFGDSSLNSANVLVKIFDDEEDAEDWITAQVSDLDPDEDADRETVTFNKTS